MSKCEGKIRAIFLTAKINAISRLRRSYSVVRSRAAAVDGFSMRTHRGFSLSLSLSGECYGLCHVMYARDDLSADVVEVAAAENRSNAHGHGLTANREGDLFCDIRISDTRRTPFERSRKFGAAVTKKYKS